MSQKAFEVGEIVTLKSHPLFYSHKIDIFTNQVPPLMLIKDVCYEDDKKKLFSSEKENIQIADKIKYTCTYFNNNKSEFVEVSVYHTFLDSYKNLLFDRKLNGEGEETRSELTLVQEVATYREADYVFGKVVQLSTNKLERRKKFTGLDNVLKISFASPDFILTGYKIETPKDLFYGDGLKRREVSSCLYKVMWYNHFQQKFSEHYLPQEFFIEKLDAEVPPSDFVEIAKPEANLSSN